MIQKMIEDLIDENSSKFEDYDYEGNYLFTFTY